MEDYLGDGVYVKFDGCAITLYTSNGEQITNVIILEEEVTAALLRFVERLK